MTEAEKAICDHILREGTVFEQDEFMCDDILVECFMVEYLDEKYTLNRTNGEWFCIHKWLRT